MKVDRVALWEAVHEERGRLVEDLQDLPEDQWELPSLCPGWSVHDVVAHLVDAATTTRLGFVRQMVVARLDFALANEHGILRHRADRPAGTLQRLRDVVWRTDTPPGPAATRLVEAFVHGEDIRRPLGMRGRYPVEHVVGALGYQARTPLSFGGGKERVRGLRLCPDDAGPTFGEDAVVRGSALALLLAASGRPVETGELRGAGADELVARA